jgi:murein DD-endopeptidase MepM/ murein hydrolase activator NlpD
MKVQLADGFDYAVGPPDAKGYYKFRGYSPNGHLGEDWNANSGGNSDLGDPIYSIGRGIVVYSANAGGGWGNCVIIRHAYRSSDGKIRLVDSQYAHLDRRDVKKFQYVEKGQQIGTMGDNNGMYYAHLHLELRHNIYVGMHRTKYPKDNRVYYSATAFIDQNRTLPASSRKYDIPVDTFEPYGAESDRVAVVQNNDPTVKVPDLNSNVVGKVEEIIGTAKENAPKSSADFWDKLKAKIKGGK